MTQTYLGSDMTTYCELALKIEPGLDVEQTLSLFAVEQDNGREAVDQLIQRSTLRTDAKAS